MKEYLEAKIEIIEFLEQDVITTSDICGSDGSCDGCDD